jgi:hypothetical protein
MISKDNLAEGVADSAPAENIKLTPFDALKSSPFIFSRTDVSIYLKQKPWSRTEVPPITTSHRVVSNLFASSLLYVRATSD